MAIMCCYGCVAPKRHPGCHGECHEYIEQKTEHDRLKTLANQKRAIESGLDSQLYKGIYRAHKAQKRIRGI